MSSGLDTSFIAHFTLFIALLLSGTIILGKLFKIIFRLPVIAGQILGGILLGPSFFNIKQLRLFDAPVQFVDKLSGNIYSLASSDFFVLFILLISSALTVSYLLWVAGHETNIKDIIKVGVTATTAGVLGAVVPVVATIFTVYFFLSQDFSYIQSIAVGVIFAATSVSIPVAMLFARNKMSLRSSKATLGAAIIDDIVAVILLSVFVLSLQSGIFGRVITKFKAHSHGGIGSSLVYMGTSLLIIIIFGYYVIPFVIRWFRAKKISHLIAPFAQVMMFVYFAFAELFGGLAGITGAYFAGLFHRRGDVRHRAEKIISPFVNTFLLPLFLGSVGLQIDVSVLSLYEWAIVFLLLFVAVFSKLFACYIAIGLSNLVRRKKDYRWSLLDGYLFGSSMVARGEVGLVIATVLNGSKVITPEQYIICVVVIILTTVASPIMISCGFYYHDKKDIDEMMLDYTVKFGLFSGIGTTQMFNIIITTIEVQNEMRTSVQMSEGRKIVHLEGKNVKIILCPEEGIVLKGNKAQIYDILNMVRQYIMHDVERLSERIDIEEESKE
ncbi:cation:proton antiporter [bacterium]|nr:cation:proton antiporter [bacterium]